MREEKMPRTGMADLPLHHGRAPRWLFERMVRLSRSLLLILAEEHGPGGVLDRLSDPFWFQALGSLLGFDWHSSGLTTTVCGALKEALRPLSREIGLFAAGGKGQAGLRTPAEIEAEAEREGFDPLPLQRSSRLAARVDAAALQDGFHLYHHVFFFDRRGRWCVIQQGMNPGRRYARRYHWQGEGGRNAAPGGFTSDPHRAVLGPPAGAVLNLVAGEAEELRRAVVELAGENPEKVIREWRRIQEKLVLPSRHSLLPTDLSPRRLATVLLTTYERAPRDFESLLETPGLGPASLRALALTAELVYGTPPSFRDPARFSFAHGGKDGHPYPVRREIYDHTVAVLERAVLRSPLGEGEKREALRRLYLWSSSLDSGGKGGETGRGEFPDQAVGHLPDVPRPHGEDQIPRRKPPFQVFHQLPLIGEA